MRLLVMLDALWAVVPRGGEHGALSGGQPSRQVVATGARFGAGVARQPRKRVIEIGAAIVALVAAGSVRPTLSPGVPGRWQATGDTLMFTPTVPFSPSTRVTVTVPAGVRSDRGSLLAKPMTAQFTTETFSSLALADLLGQLGYLPGSWRVPNLGLQVASKLGSLGSPTAAW